MRTCFCTRTEPHARPVSLLLLGLLVLLVPLVGRATEPPDTAVVATVESNPITLEDCRKMARTLGLGARLGEPAVRRAILEPLIRRELLLLEADARGIPQTWIFRHHMQRHRMNLLISIYEYWEIAKAVEIDPATVQDILVHRDRQLEVEQVLVDTAGRAQEARQALASGVPIGELAERYPAPTDSIPPQLLPVARTGSLGEVLYGFLPEPLNSAAFELAPGEVSEPLATRLGHHVLRVAGERRRLVDLDSEYEAIEKELKQREVGERKRELTRVLVERYAYEPDVESIVLFAKRLERAVAGDSMAVAEPDTQLTKTLLCDRVWFSTQERSRPLFTYRIGEFTIGDYLGFVRASRTPDNLFEARQQVERMQRDADIWFRQLALADSAAQAGYAEDEEFRRRLASYRNKLLIDTLYDQVVEPHFRPSEQDLERYYLAHRDDFVAFDRLWLARLLFDSETDARLAELALRSGTPHAELASRLRAQGTLVAYQPPAEPITRGSDPELVALFSLPHPGDVALRERADGRQEVLVVERFEEGEAVPFTEARGHVYTQMKDALAERLLAALVAELRERYDVVVHEERLARLDPAAG